ncbi:hypothetical protein, partial [Burkholderia pseudomallei]|uniref:hypothetical protein n=1 Tax=Burkholderia pseudomallei TaxID=28450 RepID=UPI00218048C2
AAARVRRRSARGGGGLRRPRGRARCAARACNDTHDGGREGGRLDDEPAQHGRTTQPMDRCDD